MGVLVLGMVAAGQGPVMGAGRFVRGDADANGSIELTDPVHTLSYLFIGGLESPCLSAADTDDNGSLEITDAIGLLGWLFLGTEGGALLASSSSAGVVAWATHHCASFGRFASRGVGNPCLGCPTR